MDESTRIIKEFYNSHVVEEWNRIPNRPEFLLTTRFLNRYIMPGNRILDIGGGPGRYSLYLAGRGCDVTLFDLSDENVRFACARASQENLPLTGIVGDARTVDESVEGMFDHILIMGPMYHLLEEADRVKAVNAALRLLKTGGTLFVSFISMFGGVVFMMKNCPDQLAVPLNQEYFDTYIENRSIASPDAFTLAYFAQQKEIVPFMEQFPLQTLHLFGQESISSPCESNIMNQPQELVDLWMEYCERVCEREELLSWAEHLMYVGRKV